MKLNDKQLKKALANVRVDLLKEKEEALKHGLDISKLWKDMQSTLK